MKTKKQNSNRNRLFMNHRRHFIKLIMGGFAGLGLIFSPLAAGIRLVWAAAKKIILPIGTISPGRYSLREGVSGLPGERPRVAQEARISTAGCGGGVLRRRLGQVCS